MTPDQVPALALLLVQVVVSAFASEVICRFVNQVAR